VLQVAEDFRAWPRVAETWRLDRFGGSGMTALFAGEPGTGKTLAAEVIAGEVGLDLMLVDLSLLVSKWVGETEKNLDAVFTEASRSHCVLFFDEADAMFGRRGEVSRGADRYANLEVGYLLQRLDRYDGLVVLATNLRDQLDEAFTRRFHHLVHFPSPRPAERRRIWELVLGPPVWLDGPVDLAVLESLELTGAGIAGVVRSAALAVHHDGREGLTMADLAGAAARQFQRESRLVPPGLLVPDASW
jgi:SpoVK/Ycf46/Vps4 family AAA+-type ATPase